MHRLCVMFVLQFLQYPTTVVCPIQFYDRWNLVRILLDNKQANDSGQLEYQALSATFHNFFVNRSHEWLSDMYIEGVRKEDVGNHFEEYLEAIQDIGEEPRLVTQ